MKDLTYPLMKRCAKCEQYKPIADFGANKSYCLDCKRAIASIDRLYKGAALDAYNELTGKVKSTKKRKNNKPTVQEIIGAQQMQYDEKESLSGTKPFLKVPAFQDLILRHLYEENTELILAEAKATLTQAEFDEGSIHYIRLMQSQIRRKVRKHNIPADARDNMAQHRSNIKNQMLIETRKAIVKDLAGMTGASIRMAGRIPPHHFAAVGDNERVGDVIPNDELYALVVQYQVH